MDALLDNIIDENSKALEECDELDGYLDKVKAELDQA